MMKTVIDFSVFTETRSLGHIHGNFALNEIVKVDDYLELHLSPNHIGKLKIEHLTKETASSEAYRLIMLESLVVKDHKEFKAIGKFVEDKYGLYCDDFTN